jgi:hypothetical protein
MAPRWTLTCILRAIALFVLLARGMAAPMEATPPGLAPVDISTRQPSAPAPAVVAIQPPLFMEEQKPKEFSIAVQGMAMF